MTSNLKIMFGTWIIHQPLNDNYFVCEVSINSFELKEHLVNCYVILTSGIYLFKVIPVPGWSNSQKTVHSVPGFTNPVKS